MSLPIRQLPTGTHTFSDGVSVPIRSLSRAEALQIRALGDDVTAVEIQCIQYATGASAGEAARWHSASPTADVEGLVNAIARLSGLDPDEGKADAEGLHSANTTESTTS